MERYLKSREVSEITGYTIKAIHQFVNSGKLKAFRHDKNCDLRFKLSDIKNFIEGENPANKRKRPAKKKHKK